MQELRHPSLQSGQHVEVRGEAWLVLNTERFDYASLVTMRGVDDDNRGQTCRVLTPFDRVRLIAHRTRLSRAPRRRALRAVVNAVAAAPRWSDCWTAGSARIDLRPWQLHPALAAVAGVSRILLADAVGLGKTIQAALIVSELAARGLAERVLVLTPASLRDQWALEFRSKFGIEATVFDHASLAAATAALPMGINPWRTATLAIASIDLVKRSEVRAAIDEVPFDILVIDEAHHVTPGTDRGAMVADLAARSAWVVMATATPHSGDDRAYHFLCGLGGNEPLVTYRRTAAQVRASTPRRVLHLAVTPTSAERALLDATLAYGRTLWSGAANRPGLRLVASVIARRAASSAAAAKQTLERRLTLIRGDATPVVQPVLPWDEGDASDAGEPDEVLALDGLANRGDEIAWLERLIRLADTALAAPSKTALIRRFLRRTTEPLIIFSEYRDVVQTVAAEISDLALVAVIHGGLTATTRGDLVRAFTHGHVRALITTDAAGEGLNLHTRCRLVINLELPWNPLRLEQRIGRVDRLGQTRRVHAVHLFHRGSFEDTVSAYLERRRARVAASLDHAAAAPRADDVAAAVFETSALDVGLLSMSQSAPDPPVTAEVFAETERRLRVLNERCGQRVADAKPLYVRCAPGGRPFQAMVLVFAIAFLDEQGRTVQSEIVPLQLEMGGRGRMARRLTKDRVIRVMQMHPVRAALVEEATRRVARATVDTTRTANGVERRAREILDTLASRRLEALVQGSLFDRRTEQQRQARRETVRAWREHFARRIAAARALTRLHAAEPRLVAVWPIGMTDRAHGTPHSALRTLHSQ